MRELLFRGKIFGRWVYGGYAVVHDGLGSGVPCIWPVGADRGAPVDPETIGQSSGLLDMSYQTIFEGDIHCSGNRYAIVRCGSYATHNPYMLAYGWYVDFGQDEHHPLDIVSDQWVDIVGNVVDNPELLGAMQNEKFNENYIAEEKCVDVLVPNGMKYTLEIDHLIRHKWPEEKPGESDYYLIHEKEYGNMSVAFYSGANETFYEYISDDSYELDVDYWWELPEVEE